MSLSNLQRTLDLFNATCNKLLDQSNGWYPTEIKRLKLRFMDYTSPELDAEVQWIFVPFRKWAKVRIRIQNDELEEFPPEDGITLYENDQPFGDENGWHIAEIFLREEIGQWDLFFENCH